MPIEPTDEGLRKLNQWALGKLQLTRKAFELTPHRDPEEQRKILAALDMQIAEKRAALEE